MENYKIKVNDEAESKEAQELFFEMGYKFEFCADIQSCRQSEAFSFPYFVQATEFGQIIFAIGQLEKAKELTLHQLRYLVAQIKNEQGLISGADAKLAWAKCEDVQISHKHATLKKEWHDLYGTLMLSAFDSDMYEFRLKPSTITLNIEIPAPFEPSECEEFYVLSSVQPTGYIRTNLKHHALLGAWRTEEQVKQVVAALRGGIKG